MKEDAFFTIKSAHAFEQEALNLFKYQYNNIPVYNTFCKYLHIQPKEVTHSSQIPFLPIQFFKSNKITSKNSEVHTIFSSSGTTGTIPSKHYVKDISLYEKSYLETFKLFYGDIKEYVILALLPAYLEREGSSLIYMVNDLIQKTAHPESGFYLNNLGKLKDALLRLDASGKKVILIGVSFALLDLVEQFQFSLKNTIVMETGGMKGRRKEMIRAELHEILSKGFGVKDIHSEYGMTELLSQAYSNGNSIFQCPPWMKIYIRDTNDPLALLPDNKTGGVNIIDLANKHSCAFIATQDLGKSYSNNTFEILGRFDHSDIRGCNLMVM